MNIEVQFVHVHRHEDLEEEFKDKLSALGQRYEWITGAHAYFKKENDHNPDHWTFEAEVRLPGSPLFAKSKTDDLRKAMNNVFQELVPQLEKRKASLYAH